jgi:hypothetical protein
VQASRRAFDSCREKIFVWGCGGIARHVYEGELSLLRLFAGKDLFGDRFVVLSYSCVDVLFRGSSPLFLTKQIRAVVFFRHPLC